MRLPPANPFNRVLEYQIFVHQLQVYTTFAVVKNLFHLVQLDCPSDASKFLFLCWKDCEKGFFAIS